MKKNMRATMDRLEIDDGIRGLIRQLWKHGYRTIKSCEGDDGESKWQAYVMFAGGDGWFEENADRYGLKKSENRKCCRGEFFVDRRKACRCGAGLNGYKIYRGKLINPYS